MLNCSPIFFVIFYICRSWIVCCFREHLVTELTWQMIISQGQRILCRNKNRLRILKGLVNLRVSTTWGMASVGFKWTANTTIQQTGSLGNRCVTCQKQFNSTYQCLQNEIYCCLWMQYDSTYHWTRPHLPLERSSNILFTVWMLSTARYLVISWTVIFKGAVIILIQLVGCLSRNLSNTVYNCYLA
jgi:hypothetical protein